MAKATCLCVCMCVLSHFKNLVIVLAGLHTSYTPVCILHDNNNYFLWEILSSCFFSAHSFSLMTLFFKVLEHILVYFGYHDFCFMLFMISSEKKHINNALFFLLCIDKNGIKTMKIRYESYHLIVLSIYFQWKILALILFCQFHSVLSIFFYFIYFYIFYI